MRVFTIGYGGRAPADFVRLLRDHGIATVVDVRIRPDRAHLGSYVLAKSPEKGIQSLLARGGVGYAWIESLGNRFRAEPDWRNRYAAFLRADIDARLAPLSGIPGPICLLCAEKNAEDCHRKLIADALLERGIEVTHIG